MLALAVQDLPTGNWLYEIKFDGYRALAIKADKEVRLISRNRKSFNDDYPVLVDSFKSLKTKSFAIAVGSDELELIKQSEWTKFPRAIA
jgi:bifunctional non-homologous end joining protein LigD